MTEATHISSASRRLFPSTPAYLLFLVWLEAGYAVALRLVAGLPWGTAAWQAAVSMVAVVPLLLAVLHLLSLPKLLRRLPRAMMVLWWNLATLAEFLLPWLGWAALIWFANYGELAWATALRAGAAIAAFSYITGLGIIVRFRPRPGDVELTRLEIPVAGLPTSFDGYQILHLSDLHANAFLSVSRIRRRLAAAGALTPDLVVFTGDLADQTPGRAEAVAEELARLNNSDGVVAVLGNHDIWAGEERAASALAENGVRVLRNEHTRLSRDGADLYLAGVNDSAYTGKADLAAALAGIPEGVVVILLSHAPTIVRDPLAGRAALILAGHTHGGQVVLPVIGPLYVPSRLGRRHAAGLHRIGNAWLFITRGVGEIIPPLRINCPPEIALLTLRAAAPN